MTGREVGFIVDDEYKAWIENIKNRIKHSQIKASVNVNHEMLDDISQPIGIAEYELTKVLREEFKSSLPTVEEIESELSE